MSRIFFVSIYFLLISACSQQSTNTVTTTPIERGRQVYLANCTACHAPNPKIDGPLGPAVAGSSRELIEARLLRASYPEGYKPKRSTLSMPAFPHLKEHIEALAAFLTQL